MDEFRMERVSFSLWAPESPVCGLIFDNTNVKSLCPCCIFSNAPPWFWSPFLMCILLEPAFLCAGRKREYRMASCHLWSPLLSTSWPFVCHKSPYKWKAWLLSRIDSCGTWEGRYWRTPEAIKSSSALPEPGIEKSRKKILAVCSRGYTSDLLLLMEAVKPLLAWQFDGQSLNTFTHAPGEVNLCRES